MANPATTTRMTPVGEYLHDGYSTKIASELDPDVSFWEVTVQPWGWDGGDMINITTMFNTQYRTMRPRALITASDSSLTVAYDPLVLDQIVALINQEGGWTITHPNGDTWDAWAVLRVFQPQEHSEGSMPMAQATISPTNYDSTLGVEAGLNYISAAGTD